MGKEIYLFRAEDNDTYKSFKNRMLEISNSFAENTNPQALKITITENHPPGISIIPFRRNKVAVISMVTNNAQSRNDLSKVAGISGAWLVTEALPVKYEKTWSNHMKTPGACLLTLFKKRTNIDHNTFIHRWHNSHTPLSLKIHPLWHYNRNVVGKKLVEKSEDWHGIVEEHCRTTSELLNPVKFFGGPLKMLPNMLKVYTDTRSFLDYKTIETYLVAEYIVV